MFKSRADMYNYVHKIVVALAKKSHMNVPMLVICKKPYINAYSAYNILQQCNEIRVTEDDIKYLNKTELSAMIAHEFGHFKQHTYPYYNDVVNFRKRCDFSTFLACITLLIFYATIILNTLNAITVLNYGMIARDCIESLLVIIFIPLCIVTIDSFYELSKELRQRHAEYKADLFGSELVGNNSEVQLLDYETVLHGMIMDNNKKQNSKFNIKKYYLQLKGKLLFSMHPRYAKRIHYLIKHYE